MKAKLRIPTQEYAFIEVDIDGEADDIIQAHDELMSRVRKNEDGLSDKDWRRTLDEYLTTATMDSNDYTGMSQIQKYVIQEIKKAFKRINKHEDSNNNEN